MNYENISSALKEEERLDAELGKVGEGVEYFVDGHGDVHEVKVKKSRNGGDLDALDGVL
tara:strand:- start:318 stop:494 length:177 start_codon:yes stop_codon:yes gene_type:complete